MNLRTTAIVAGLAAALGTGTAFAQSYAQGYPPSAPQAPYPDHQGGVLALIQDEVRAGRISVDEGNLLEQQIRQMKAERRAERQGAVQGSQGNYGGPEGYPQ